MRTRERDKVVAFKEVEDALAVKIRDDADVVPEIEAVAQVDASVGVLPVVGRQGGEHAQFDAGGIAILWHGSDYLDGALRPVGAVIRFDDFAESSLAQQFGDLIWRMSVTGLHERRKRGTYIAQ